MFQHKMGILRTEGSDTDKLIIDYIFLEAGEVVDIYTTGDQDPVNYWIRGETIEQFSSEEDQVHFVS